MSLFKEIIWNYSFYKKVMNGLLSAMGLSSADPDSPGPHASPKTQIAVTCEVKPSYSDEDTATDQSQSSSARLTWVFFVFFSSGHEPFVISGHSAHEPTAGLWSQVS